MKHVMIEGTLSVFDAFAHAWWECTMYGKPYKTRNKTIEQHWM